VKMAKQKGSNFLVLNDVTQDRSSAEYLSPSYNVLEAVKEDENSDSNDENLSKRNK